MATVSYTLDPHSLSDLAALIGRVAVRAPELTSRAERAGGILTAGKCHPVAPERFAVRGSDDVIYAVNTADGVCTCPDVANGAPERNGVKWCKHLIAAVLLTRLTAAAIKRQARADFDRFSASATVRVPLVGRLAV